MDCCWRRWQRCMEEAQDRISNRRVDHMQKGEDCQLGALVCRWPSIPAWHCSILTG